MANDNIDDVRSSLLEDEFEADFGVREVASREVNEGRIFGLTAGERMILSVILFLAVSVVSVALLFLTRTVAIP